MTSICLALVISFAGNVYNKQMCFFMFSRQPSKRHDNMVSLPRVDDLHPARDQQLTTWNVTIVIKSIEIKPLKQTMNYLFDEDEFQNRK